MILSDVRDYVREHGRASLRDIAVKFDLPETAVLEMLAHWERKGVIRRSAEVPPCGGKCAGCVLQCAAVFYWNDPNLNK